MMAEHKPVLLDEVVAGLAIQKDGFYIDATFGRGGHSAAILERLSDKGRLLVMDRDPSAIAVANDLFGDDPRVIIRHTAFSGLQACCKALGVEEQVSGILLDLGVSSPQLDDAARGFSFMRDGPLDMRMDPTTGKDAAFWLSQAPVEEIVDVLRTYGEERYAKRIAGAIVARREVRAFSRTGDLAEVIKAAHPRWEKHKHPATRSFQAIRIFVNRELEELESVLVQCLDVLASQGRLCVMSFHSLEDRMVKRFIQKEERGPEIHRDIPIRAKDIIVRMRRVGKKTRAAADEVNSNLRARSAVLRVAEKL